MSSSPFFPSFPHELFLLPSNFVTPHSHVLYHTRFKKNMLTNIALNKGIEQDTRQQIEIKQKWKSRYL